jgi:transposase
MEKTYIGVDVSKDTLEVFIPGRKVTTHLNNKDAIKDLVRTLNNLGSPVHVVCEATGIYEKAMVTALWDANLPVSVVNPRRPHAFAQCRGRMAKTDPIDARNLSEYGQFNKPEPSKRPDAQQQTLAQLLDYRNHLIETRKRLNQQMEYLDDPLCRKQGKQLLALLDKQMEKTEAQAHKLVAANAEMKEKAERMSRIRGVAALTAAHMLAYLPELGTLNRREIASLAGLAPRNHDSGKILGKRFIGGGRHKVRKALFMTTVSFCQFDSMAKAMKQALIDKGKPWKVAITAMMRHLLILLNEILKSPNFVLKSAP